MDDRKQVEQLQNRISVGSSNMGNMGNDLLAELLTGETADLFFIRESLSNFLVEACSNGQLCPNARLRFFINDKAGKSYYYKTKVKISTFLQKNNKVSKNEN